MKSLNTMITEVYNNNQKHGWFGSYRTFGDDIALMHSELSEMLECYREIGIHTRTEDNGKPNDIYSEAADVLIRLLDTCIRYGIDLESEYERKMAYNRNRSHRHGNKTL